MSVSVFLRTSSDLSSASNARFLAPATDAISDMFLMGGTLPKSFANLVSPATVAVQAGAPVAAATHVTFGTNGALELNINDPGGDVAFMGVMRAPEIQSAVADLTTRPITNLATSGASISVRKAISTGLYFLGLNIATTAGGSTSLVSMGVPSVGDWFCFYGEVKSGSHLRIRDLTRGLSKDAPALFARPAGFYPYRVNLSPASTLPSGLGAHDLNALVVFKKRLPLEDEIQSTYKMLKARALRLGLSI